VGFYTSVFANSRVVSTTRYGKESAQASGRPEGSVMTIAFQAAAQGTWIQTTRGLVANAGRW
jgi:predicted 3-demethylubiquinone-9 3-methyltransferase (glyoxalase superfamily)